ncbi:RNA polymerase ECF-type sigma factor [Pedobacter sp. BAL39]|uniref:RNA polymerase sigma factor n=1 Tax=Pedobacter sp. BAL39 TaxID=391596 RepID=UPI0001559BE0|nr:RNA polymerase sigma factor [Pedobacter sp. BAL39]EDM36733.1 RNA polymerase ECF-type sigma factor [Pedobacter sp. BAL39]
MKNITFNYQIYDHKSSLQNFAMNFTKNVEDANDLVQDTMLKAIRYSALYQKGTNLRGWLFTIMRNTFINNYRRMSKRQSVITTTEDLSSYQLTSSASNNQGENKMMMEDIQKALEKLQPEYYTPFIKYFEGYKYHEIADKLGIPIGTVKTRIHVARQVLKGNLKMYSEEFKRTSRYA